MTSGHACCCDTPETCDIASDDFSSDTITGGDWNEDAGSWSIGSGVLTTSSVSGDLEFQTTHPDAIDSHIVSVKVKATTSGDKARIRLCSDLYIELTFTTDGCGTLKLFDAAAEVASTEVWGATLDTFHLLKGCYHDGDTAADQKFVGIFYESETGSTAAYVLEDTSTSANGTQVALATGDTVSGTITFDDFDWKRHKSDATDYCSECRHCQIFIRNMMNEDCLWTEAAGTWGFDSAGLYTASNNALLLSDIEHSEHAWNHFLSGQFAAYFGDVIRLYINYEDSSNYVMAEIKFSSSSVWGTIADGYIKLYDGVTLRDSDLNLSLHPLQCGLQLCMAESGGTYTAKYKLWEAGVLRADGSGTISSTLGDLFGIGTGVIAGVVHNGVAGPQFVNMQFLRSTSDDSDCYTCFSSPCADCPENEGPDTWTVTIAGVTNTLICTGCLSLNASHICIWLGSCYWAKTIWICGVPCTVVTQVLPYNATHYKVKASLNMYYGGNFLDFSALIAKTTNCADIAAQALTLETVGGNWSSMFGPACGPVNGTGITCLVTAN